MRLHKALYKKTNRNESSLTIHQTTLSYSLIEGSVMSEAPLVKTTSLSERDQAQADEIVAAQVAQGFFVLEDRSEAPPWHILPLKGI